MTRADAMPRTGHGDELRQRLRRALARTRQPPSLDAVQRPALSPLLPALACAWVGVVLSVSAVVATSFGEQWLGHAPILCIASLCAAAITVGLTLGLRLQRARTFIALALVGLLAGVVAGTAFAVATHEAGERLRSVPVSSYAFTVETDPKRSASGGLSFEANAQYAPQGSSRPGDAASISTVPFGARVWVSLSASAVPEAPLRMGEVIHLTGSWDAPESNDWGRGLLSRGCATTIKAKRCAVEGTQGGPIGAIRRLRSRLLDVVSPTASEGRALLAGVVLGEQASLASFPVNGAFANLGLSHLVAVSGSHLALIAGMLGIALGGLRLRPHARLGLSALVLGAYVILSGLQPSALRSLAMVMAAQGASLVGRRGHALSALGGVALGMLLLDPANAGRMGFTLSVLSVLGITALAGLIGRWVDALTHPLRLPQAARDALALTLVSQALTAPVTLPTFGVLPVLSPLANVLAAPLMSALLVIGLICVPFAGLFPVLADTLLTPCDLLARACCALASTLSQIPYAALPCEIDALPSALICAALALDAYLAWPLPRPHVARIASAIPLVIVGTLFVSWRLLAPARVTVLDIGQGDAILVQQGASALLVDTGPDKAILGALARTHVLHLDAVMLTHTDIDHTGGLTGLEGLVSVDRVIVAQGVAESIRQNDPALQSAIDRVAHGRIQEVTAGDSVRVGAFKVDVASPSEVVDGTENPDSIVAVARYGPPGPLHNERALSVLLTGDAERDLTGPLARTGALGDVDVLKVGHHGSAVSTSQELIAGCTPELAVVSAGAHNRYGHPTQACRDELDQAGVPLLCTIEAGDIELRPGESGATVRCQHPEALATALSVAG